MSAEIMDDEDDLCESPRFRCEGIVASADFRSVRWGDRLFEFTTAQSQVVQRLLEHLRDGVPVVGGDYLLEVAGSAYSVTLRALFDNGRHPAWKTMIQSSSRRNNFQIIPPLR